MQRPVPVTIQPALGRHPGSQHGYPISSWCTLQSDVTVLAMVLSAVHESKDISGHHGLFLQP